LDDYFARLFVLHESIRTILKAAISLGIGIHFTKTLAVVPVPATFRTNYAVFEDPEVWKMVFDKALMTMVKKKKVDYEVARKRDVDMIIESAITHAKNNRLSSKKSICVHAEQAVIAHYRQTAARHPPLCYIGLSAMCCLPCRLVISEANPKYEFHGCDGRLHRAWALAENFKEFAGPLYDKLALLICEDLLHRGTLQIAPMLKPRRTGSLWSRLRHRISSRAVREIAVNGHLGEDSEKTSEEENRMGGGK
jgi:hypothetical protein